MTSEMIERLRELEAKATKGPWETDTYMPNSESEASFQIIGPDGVLFESSNCDTRCINYEADEHGTHYWDEGSKPNFDFVAALRNAAPAILALAAEAEELRSRVTAELGLIEELADEAARCHQPLTDARAVALRQAKAMILTALKTPRSQAP